MRRKGEKYSERKPTFVPGQAPVSWNRLDNAAKIFPPTSTKRDSKVFRFACELTEPVDGGLLRRALDEVIGYFPFYRSVLKRGLFWYYLEETDLQPEAHEENTPLCAALYDKNVRRLLFDVTWYGYRISLEIYHSLSDGTGALHFLRMLVYQYLLLAHPEEYAAAPPPMNYDASQFQKSDDSFEKYYQKNQAHLREKRLRAYRLRGSKAAENRIRLIEGVVPTRALLDKAHEYGGTVSSFVAAVLMCAIADVMRLRDKRRPVVITLPVNLRQFFFSESARNFFSTVEVGYDFQHQSRDLRDVVAYVSGYFQQQLTAEQMARRMNELAALEHNMGVRAVPRVVKDLGLRAANAVTDMSITAALSNVGKVDMPDEMARHIRLFDVFVSTERLQICMCSYGGNTTVSFTSAFENSEVQKNFFRTLTGMGIPVTLLTPPECV